MSIFFCVNVFKDSGGTTCFTIMKPSSDFFFYTFIFFTSFGKFRGNCLKPERAVWKNVTQTQDDTFEKTTSGVIELRMETSQCMHCYTYVKRTVLKKCLNCFISLQHGDTGILLLFSSRCSSSSSLSAGLNLKCCFYDNNPLRPAPGTETTEKDVFHIHPSSALSISAGAEASPSCYGPRQVTSLSQGNTTIPAHFYNYSQESLINLSFLLPTCDSLCSLHSSYVSARNWISWLMSHRQSLNQWTSWTLIIDKNMTDDSPVSDVGSLLYLRQTDKKPTVNYTNQQ